MTNTKMTKRDYFNMVIAMASGEEFETAQYEALQNFAKHEIELLDRKHSSGSKTKTQKLNEELVEKVFIALASEENPVTVTELVTGHPEELVNPEKDNAVMTNQKVSALMKKLVDAGRVEKTTEKGKSLFSVK